MIEKDSAFGEQNPPLLHHAIRQLKEFTLPETSRFARIFFLARFYIAPQLVFNRKKELGLLKSNLLKARDTVVQYLPMIKEWQKGKNSDQKKFAEEILSTIERYNAVIRSKKPEKEGLYHYEKWRLLQELEIKEGQIELPETCSIKYDSRQPSTHPARSALKNIADLACDQSIRSFSPIVLHKNNEQFMIDIFKIKALRMLGMYPEYRLDEILRWVNQNPIEMKRDPENPLIIRVWLSIETSLGASIILTGNFTHSSGSVDRKLLTMPILADFRLTFSNDPDELSLISTL